MKLRRIGLIILALLFGAWRSASAQGVTINWDVDGVQRSAIVFAPATSSGDAKHPLLFAWHGHGGNAQISSKVMRFQELWPDAIVVYPQGLPSPTPRDPAGLRPGWQFSKGEGGDRDLKFFDAMLKGLKQNYTVDEKRIYTTGFSNGAIFSYLLWAERGDGFAGFAIVGGALTGKVMPKIARPAVIIAGETDQIMPFEKQQQSIEAIRKLDQATGSGQACGLHCLLYASTVQTPVETWIFPRGHVYPPWAAQATVDFFKAHSLLSTR